VSSLHQPSVPNLNHSVDYETSLGRVPVVCPWIGPVIDLSGAKSLYICG
jgi:hypothetical protein